MVAAIDGIERIRYTTSHPLEFSDSLIQAHAEVPELVKHLHLPVQSGSDRILSAMKRNHTALEYKSKLRKLRAAVPCTTGRLTRYCPVSCLSVKGWCVARFSPVPSV